MLAIMPMSSCSALWQWKRNRPRWPSNRVVDVRDRAPHLDVAEPDGDAGAGRVERQPANEPAVPAARDLTPKIVFEGDEPGAIQELISAGLGIGLNPAMARRVAARTPVAWIPVDSPDCRRTITVFWSTDSRLPAAARLMRTAITEWDWAFRRDPARVSAQVVDLDTQVR
jgi:DNA-binding transcriptional LysR family regulator